MVMLVVCGIIMSVVVIVTMIMLFKRRPQPIFQHRRTRHGHQLDLTRFTAKGFKRPFQPRFQRLSDPENSVGAIQCGSLRRAQRIPVRRSPRFNQQGRFANPLHHPRDKRMHRRNIGHHMRGFSQDGTSQQGRAAGHQGQTHFLPRVIV